MIHNRTIAYDSKSLARNVHQPFLFYIFFLICKIGFFLKAHRLENVNFESNISVYFKFEMHSGK